jgi:signal transduction histidine kinase
MNPQQDSGPSSETEKLIREISHEIKNPLSTIYLTIDSLRHAKEEGEDPEFYIGMLEKAAKKIDAILSEYAAPLEKGK